MLVILGALNTTANAAEGLLEYVPLYAKIEMSDTLSELHDKYPEPKYSILTTVNEHKDIYPEAKTVLILYKNPALSRYKTAYNYTYTKTLSEPRITTAFIMVNLVNDKVVSINENIVYSREIYSTKYSNLQTRKQACRQLSEPYRDKFLKKFNIEESGIENKNEDYWDINTSEYIGSIMDHTIECSIKFSLIMKKY